MAAHQEYYAGVENAARVLLLGAPKSTGRVYGTDQYRGIFRVLTEEHIPFAVSDNAATLSTRRFDLAIATDWTPPELARYADAGGRVLVVSSRRPDLPGTPPSAMLRDVKGYLRVRDHSAYPSLDATNLLMLDGAFSETAPAPHAPLTLVPPSMIGPPELVHIDQKDTDTPGIVPFGEGKGSVTWIPWDLGGLYYRLSLPAHEHFFRDVFNRLEPRRQLLTNAHPLLETTLLRQNGKLLLHLINLSGHSDTGWFEPVPMTSVSIKVDGNFTRATSLRNPGRLQVRAAAGYSEIVLPRITDYELVAFEK